MNPPKQAADMPTPEEEMAGEYVRNQYNIGGKVKMDGPGATDFLAGFREGKRLGREEKDTENETAYRELQDRWERVLKELSALRQKLATAEGERDLWRSSSKNRSEMFQAACAENRRLREALEKIADPRKRHKEPDAYTELGCVMNIANEALAPPAEEK